jgi:3-oxoacyl-[acyl-carrier protein] reductase
MTSSDPPTSAAAPALPTVSANQPPYALVTGASRGIGAAIARRLARDGFDIVVNFRTSRSAAETVAAAIAQSGRQAWLDPYDVTDRAATRAALERMLAERGVPTAVVVNAGITRDGLLAFMGDEEWDTVIATALGGFYNIIRPLIGPLLKARRGRIVSIASVSGLMGNAGQVNYSAAKGGVIAASKALAREIAKRSITVNVVAPGLIDTDMLAGLPIEQMLKVVPMARLGTSEEVAAAVSFLCSSEAGYITGQVLSVNGGLHT